MKLKLLFVPVVIIILGIVTVGIILPKVFEAKDSSEKLKKAEQDLAQTVDKINRINILSQELSANTEKQNILLRYIPASRQEEIFVNNLESIASAQGVTLTKLSLSSKAEEIKGEAINDLDGTAKLQLASNNKLKTANVDVMIVGNYEQIKSFLEKVRSMQRFADVLSLKILKGEEIADADPNRLNAEMTIGFGYMEEINIANASSDMLSGGKFNMSVIDKIANNAKTEFSDVTVGQAGRTNPFLP